MSVFVFTYIPMQTTKTNGSHNEQCNRLPASLQSSLSLSIVASLPLTCVLFHTTFRIFSLVLSLIHSFAHCYRKPIAEWLPNRLSHTAIARTVRHRGMSSCLIRLEEQPLYLSPTMTPTKLYYACSGAKNWGA